QYGYTAGLGWDAVTGLGSLDVNQFVQNWALPGARITTTTTSLTANPTTIAATASTTLSATVKAADGSALPAGQVQFTIRQTVLGSAVLNQSGGGAVAQWSVKGSQLAAGANTITATYGGSLTFGSSSATATVTVTGAGSAVTASVTPAQVYSDAPDADGYTW